MRVLLLIMTGIGFSLGLLCGLLLHLPADGLPAGGGGAIADTDINNNNHHNDLSFRSRRSFSSNDEKRNHKNNHHHSRYTVNNGEAVVGGGENATVVNSLLSLPEGGGGHGGGGGGGKSGPEPVFAGQAAAVQSAPNPAVGPNPIVSEPGVNSGRGRPARLNGRGGGQAERSGPSVNGGSPGPEENGQGGVERLPPFGPALPDPLPPAKPVTSYTLRLKNTGGKFVVDSAVKRLEGEGEGEEEAAAAEGRFPRDGTRAIGRSGQSDTEIQTSAQRRSHNYNSNNKDKSVTNASGSNKAPNDNSSSSSSSSSSFKSLEHVVSSGVLWSRDLDDSCRKGQHEGQDSAWWRRKASGMAVVRMEEGCGRMQNRLVTFKDGSQACARYRINTDQIQGEVFSYYLAQLLNITNLPPALLLPVDSVSPQWRGVHLQMSSAQWADGHLVVLTRWLQGLAPSYIPQELREDSRRLHPTLAVLGGKTSAELCDLLQWSDLIVFDYLTANLDRLVNNMFNRQWNAEMMANPAHNLERRQDGSLVFLDNESGLFHGYRLLHKYHGYHDALLGSLCVFRASTARAVSDLHRSKAVGKELTRLFRQGELHHKQLPTLPDKNAAILEERLAKVYEQIQRCQQLYPAAR